MGLQLSGSIQLEGNLLVTGSANSVFENILVSGKLTAQEIETQFVSASIIYSSGSNKFGDEITDNHQFTGSLVVSGTLAMGTADKGVGRVLFNESTNTLRIQSSKDGTECTPIEFWSQAAGGLFTQSMSISGSNVGIGTTSSPPFKLEVKGAIPAKFTADSTADSPTYGGVIFYRPTATVNNGNGFSFNLNDSSGVQTEYAYIGGLIETNTEGSPNGAIIFAPTIANSRTERMRITSGGYLKASSDGTYVNSTAGFHEMTATGNGSDALLIRHSTSGVPYGIEVDFSVATPNDSTSWFFYAQDATAARFIVYSDGGIDNYQSNDSDLSDERVKSEITPLSSSWDEVKGYEIVSYKYIDQTHDDVNIGVIAQQIESVNPNLIAEKAWISGSDDTLKSVYNKDLYFTAIKALQEAMIRIEQLETKVAQLQNN